MSLFEIVCMWIFVFVGFDDVVVLQVFGVFVVIGVDIVDLYFESIKMCCWWIEDGWIVGGSFVIEQGVGVCVVYGGEVVFFYMVDLCILLVMEVVGIV